MDSDRLLLWAILQCHFILLGHQVSQLMGILDRGGDSDGTAIVEVQVAQLVSQKLYLAKVLPDGVVKDRVLARVVHALLLALRDQVEF
jgi:hypothetical protein